MEYPWSSKKKYSYFKKNMNFSCTNQKSARTLPCIVGEMTKQRVVPPPKKIQTTPPKEKYPPTNQKKENFFVMAEDHRIVALYDQICADDQVDNAQLLLVLAIHLNDVNRVSNVMDQFQVNPLAPITSRSPWVWFHRPTYRAEPQCNCDKYCSRGGSCS